MEFFITVGKYAMSGEDGNGFGAPGFEEFGGFDQGIAGDDQVVDDELALVC